MKLDEKWNFCHWASHWWHFVQIILIENIRFCHFIVCLYINAWSIGMQVKWIIENWYARKGNLYERYMTPWNMSINDHQRSIHILHRNLCVLTLNNTCQMSIFWGITIFTRIIWTKTLSRGLRSLEHTFGNILKDL